MPLFLEFKATYKKKKKKIRPKSAKAMIKIKFENLTSGFQLSWELIVNCLNS